jgi:hypothetical protein
MKFVMFEKIEVFYNNKQQQTAKQQHMLLRECLRYRQLPWPNRRGLFDGSDMLEGSAGQSLIQVPCHIQIDYFITFL